MTTAATQANLAPTPSRAAWRKLSRPEQWQLVRDNADKSRAALADLVARGALVVCSHSGGKDSQAMYAWLKARVPAEQLVVVHATLGRFEWGGVIEHIESTIDGELHIAQAIDKTGADKDFRDLVLSRQMFPSPSTRNCTSDLKRGPIAKVIRRLVKETGRSLVVECLGVRAEESEHRRRTSTASLSYHAGNSKAGREWYSFLPLADWTIEQVWDQIADAGQVRHWAYDAGMTRLSCSFCIMASRDDQRRAAELRPDLYAEIVALEKHCSHTMSMSRRGLEEVTGVAACPSAVAGHLRQLDPKASSAARDALGAATAEHDQLELFASKMSPA